MTSQRQCLQASHLFSDEQDCSCNTSQLENETQFCSVSILTQSSRLSTNHNPYPANKQCFLLYHDEALSSQPSMFSQRTLHGYINFGNKTFKCCHYKTLFWLNERFTHSTQSIQNSLLVGKLSFRDHCQHLSFLMTC
uniref:Uncharacterized protein n=1 Tax=Salix viminalis TaxID=40686 RepID=A0A6N2KJM4_SALVM